jgi:hypothetical protein|eukprot:COSAG01_NODE_3191_length_6436_cov_14.338646_9_plen_60_part_00
MASAVNGRPYCLPWLTCVHCLARAREGLVTASLKVARNPLRAYYNKTLLADMDYSFPDK